MNALIRIKVASEQGVNVCYELHCLLPNLLVSGACVHSCFIALGRIRCFCLSQAARDVQQVQETQWGAQKY